MTDAPSFANPASLQELAISVVKKASAEQESE
jgi:aspartyl-tRNA synthetase